MTPEKEPVRVYLILGSNMGDRHRNLSIAVSLIVTELAPWLFSDVRESDVLETEPWGMPEETEPFMNQAISFETTVPPEDLLKVCKWVEHKLGRRHRPLRRPYGEHPRTHHSASTGRGTGLRQAPSLPDYDRELTSDLCHRLHCLFSFPARESWIWLRFLFTVT